MSGPPPQQYAECALAAVDLVGGYDGRRVLDGLTLFVRQGRITVVMGPSGAGKTTCVRHLVGLALPWSGRVLLDGRDTRQMTDEQLRGEQQKLSVMLQGSALFGAGLAWSLSVFDNVAYPLRSRSSLREPDVAERVRRSLRQVGLVQQEQTPLGSLSAGMVQRVSLARALVSGSPTVVLDSPDTGVDSVRMHAVADAVKAAHAETGATFLIATHHAGLARAVGQDLAVLRAGRIIDHGPVDEVLRDADRFPAQFLRGDPASGLAMTDDLEGPVPPTVAPDDAGARRAVALAAVAGVVLLAMLLLIVVALVVLRGPNVPPGP